MRPHADTVSQLTTAQLQICSHSITTQPLLEEVSSVQPICLAQIGEAATSMLNSAVLKIKELASDKLASGYSSNRQHWDGTFWRTESNTHTDMVRTLYRQGFN